MQLKKIYFIGFCFQDENWGETTTAVTTTSDLDYGAGYDPNGLNTSVAGGDGMDKWKVNTERGMLFRFKRHAHNLFSALLALLVFVSPILMVALPSFDLIELREAQRQCVVECDGNV